MSEIHIKDETRQPEKPLEYLRLYLIGLLMGAADTVPGVSGGTVAFVMGIYGDLLHAIKSANLDMIKKALRFQIGDLLKHLPLRFLITLLAGIATSVLTLVRVIEPMMRDDRQSTLLFALFMGFVLGSAVAIIPKIKQWNIAKIAALVVGTVVAFVIVNLTPTQSESSPVTLFFSGMAAIIAMILPGISGSSILLVLGQYQAALAAVKEFDIVRIVSLAAGCVVGLVVFSRFLTWVLRRFEQVTVAVLIGFVIGSLWAVWPWKNFVRDAEGEILNSVNRAPDTASPDFVLTLVLLVFGFLLVNFIDHLASGENPIFRRIWRRQPAALPAVDKA